MRLERGGGNVIKGGKSQIQCSARVEQVYSRLQCDSVQIISHRLSCRVYLQARCVGEVCLGTLAVVETTYCMVWRGVATEQRRENQHARQHQMKTSALAQR